MIDSRKKILINNRFLSLSNSLYQQAWSVSILTFSGIFLKMRDEFCMRSKTKLPFCLLLFLQLYLGEGHNQALAVHAPISLQNIIVLLLPLLPAWSHPRRARAGRLYRSIMSTRFDIKLTFSFQAQGIIDCLNGFCWFLLDAFRLLKQCKHGFWHSRNWGAEENMDFSKSNLMKKIIVNIFVIIRVNLSSTYLTYQQSENVSRIIDTLHVPFSTRFYQEEASC